jgi:hypothetical protein
MNLRALPPEFALIASILTNATPLMDRAACRGRHDAFDKAAGTREQKDVQRAIAVCASCPERSPCAEWVAGLDDQSRASLGVAGGIAWIPVRETRSQAAVATAQRPRSRVESRSGTGTTTVAAWRAERRAERIARSKARDDAKAAAS